MKPIQLALLAGLLGLFTLTQAQTTITAGAAPGTMTLVPFTPTCFGNGSTSTNACGNPVTFNFTSFQISSCPNSGQMPSPGSVAYGGPGSSASFSFYHTLSYSPSNEHQQLLFNQPIQTFQFSTSGPYGSGEVFSVQVYNGATQVGNHNFNVPGQGINLTYYITGVPFDRVQFTEINAVSADDELFGDFFVAGPGCPLPVEMLAAHAEIYQGDRVRIDWDTQGESALDYFEVQRSFDGQNWEALGQRSALNSDGPNHYRLNDLNPLNGINYYRIETVGIDGDHNFSQVMQVNVTPGPGFNVLVWPNPTQNTTQIDFAGLEGPKTVQVTNLLGQSLETLRTEGQTLSLDVSGYESAVYLLKIQHDGRTLTRKLVVD